MAKKPKPNDPPPDDDDDEETEPFSARQLEILNNTVTAAVSAHVGRKIKPLTDQLTTLGESLQEKIDAIAKGGQQPPAGGQQPPTGQQPPAGGAPDPEKVQMQKRLAALEEERKTERLTARNATRDTTLTEIATKAGVDKNRLRGAVAILRDQVKYDETSSKHVMTVKRNGFDEDVDLEAGAGEWFKTDEGKSYLAPTQQAPRGGSGNRSNASTVVRGQGNQPANGGAGKADKKAEAANALMGAVGELLGGGNINVG